MNQEDRYLIDPYGIDLEGAVICGELSLAFINVSFPLRFKACRFENSVDLSYAEVKLLEFPGARMPGLSAVGIRVRGDMKLNDVFSCHEQVNLAGAVIDGDLDCSGGTFGAPTSTDFIALVADGLKIDGNVFLSEQFKAHGEVRLLGSSIGLNLDCEDGTFANKHGPSFRQTAQILKATFFFVGNLRLTDLSVCPG
jgi:hypothetical protein